MSKNPWTRAQDETEHGRAVIHVGLKTSTYGNRKLYRFVGQFAEAASVVAQVGITHDWGQEPSAQVILINGSY